MRHQSSICIPVGSSWKNCLAVIYYNVSLYYMLAYYNRYSASPFDWLNAWLAQRIGSECHRTRQHHWNNHAWILWLRFDFTRSCRSCSFSENYVSKFRDERHMKVISVRVNYRVQNLDRDHVIVWRHHGMLLVVEDIATIYTTWKIQLEWLQNYNNCGCCSQKRSMKLRLLKNLYWPITKHTVHACAVKFSTPHPPKYN